MDFIVIVWIVWGVLALVLLGLLLYHISITQYEEDRLFLDGGNDLQHSEQTEMLARLKRLRPLIRICGGAEAIATLILVAFYILDALHQF